MESKKKESSPSLGWCHRSQARPGEVKLLLGKPHEGRICTLRDRLSSIGPVHLALDRVSFLLAWVRTLLLEIRSLYFRIQAIHARRLVGRYEMGLTCLSCQNHGTEYRCKATLAYIDHTRQLGIRLPWLSYSDNILVREGWDLAFQSRLDTLDCGIERDLDDAFALHHLPGGDSIPEIAVQQSSKYDPTAPPSSRELRADSNEHGRKAITKCIAPVENVNSWDAAIAKARHKIATLKRDIVAFQEMKDSGEPWPGTQSSDQNSSGQHSV